MNACVWRKKKGRKEKTTKGREGGKIESRSTIENLGKPTCRRIGSVWPFEIFSTRIHNPREYRFFQLSFQRHKGSSWFHTVRGKYSCLSCLRERYFWRVTSCNTVEKHCPYLFFQREKVNCSNNEDEKKDFFPSSSNIMKIVTNPTWFIRCHEKQT